MGKKGFSGIFRTSFVTFVICSISPISSVLGRCRIPSVCGRVHFLSLSPPGQKDTVYALYFGPGGYLFGLARYVGRHTWDASSNCNPLRNVAYVESKRQRHLVRCHILTSIGRLGLLAGFFQKKTDRLNKVQLERVRSQGLPDASQLLALPPTIK